MRPFQARRGYGITFGCLVAYVSPIRSVREFSAQASLPGRPFYVLRGKNMKKIVAAFLVLSSFWLVPLMPSETQAASSVIEEEAVFEVAFETEFGGEMAVE